MAILAFEPNEIPPGFLKEILTAQRRFVGDRDASAADEEAGTVRRRFDDALADVMSRIPNSTPPSTVDGGALVLMAYMGSAAVRVTRYPFSHSFPPVIQFASPLVREIKFSEDLAKTLNLMSAKELFYRFFWIDGAVWMDYEFVMDGVNEPLFLWSFGRFAGAADHFDTIFRDRFGGVISRDDQRAVFDA